MRLIELISIGVNIALAVLIVLLSYYTSELEMQRDISLGMQRNCLRELELNRNEMSIIRTIYSEDGE